jgi:hydroxymethylglutaryl-CoA synthase
MFSYGSGLAATLFSIKVSGAVTFIRDQSRVVQRLASRTCMSPKDFEANLQEREQVSWSHLASAHR